MRIRGSVIIVENKKVGLIKRERNDSIYYVFPGGGIETGETIEEGTIREAFEELGVEVKLNKCIATYEFNGVQYFYHSEVINGIFGTGVGEEFTNNKSERGSYQPIWVDIDSLLSIDVRPKEVALTVFSLFK
ncbi:NUDIX domain-containing protein [Niallia taxi]|nr:NUDIX domain-containing protein [Niallia taxi]MDE5055309.1 NUDIX domain-containing protein [Niallia taxi]